MADPTFTRVTSRGATSEFGKCRLVVGVAFDQGSSEKLLGSQKRGKSVTNLGIIEFQPMHLFVDEEIS